MTLRAGIIARSEDRGLGVQSLDVCRHLNPERVLLIQPTPNRWVMHADWYDRWDTTPIVWPTSGRNPYTLDERTVRRWLKGLDVIYTAETLYSWELAGWATTAGCAVVVHANPEMLPPIGRTTPGVNWWAATPWLLDRLPAGTRVVPMPVDTAQARPVGPVDGPVRFLHVAGHSAHLDRNGTRVLATAVSRLRANCHLTVTGQDGRLPPFQPRDRRNVTIDLIPSGHADRWDAYQGDVFIMPRKFGGLCLSAMEAMACGMAVAMTDVAPNGVWPGPRFPCRNSGDQQMLGGPIPVCEPDPTGVRTMIEWLAAKPGDVERHKADAQAWAAANSWEALLPTWWAELEKAAGG